MDAMFGAIIWWAFGFAFAFGYRERFGDEQEFLGHIGFFGRDIEDCELGFFFFQFTFAITASTSESLCFEKGVVGRVGVLLWV